MPRTHSHWEGGPVCRFATKKECDDWFKQVMAARKAAYDELQAALLTEKKTRLVAAFDSFIAKEKARMEAFADGRDHDPDRADQPARDG